MHTKLLHVGFEVAALERRLGAGRDKGVLGRVVVDFVEEADHGHAVAPAVLEVDARLAVGVHDQRVVLVEPAIVRVAVQEAVRQIVRLVRVRLVQRYAKERRVDCAQRLLVAARDQLLAQCRPCVAVLGREHTDRVVGLLQASVQYVAYAGVDLFAWQNVV